MKRVILKLKEIIFQRHPALLVALGIVLLIFILIDVRQSRIQPNLELAERYLEVARFYRNNQNISKARQAVYKAIALTEQPFIKENPQLANALYEHAQLIQANPDSLRRAVSEYIRAGNIKPDLQDTVATHIQILLNQAFAECSNSEKARGLEFFTGSNSGNISTLTRKQIKEKLTSSKDEWMQALDYFCIK